MMQNNEDKVTRGLRASVRESRETIFRLSSGGESRLDRFAIFAGTRAGEEEAC